MTDPLPVSIFYPDTEAPEGGAIPPASLSPRWLGVCGDILAAQGPVFDHNMGSTLSHFDVKLAGPVGQFLAHGEVQFDLAVLNGRSKSQDDVTLSWFTELWRRHCAAMGHSPSAESLSAVCSLGSGPSVLIYDHVRVGLPEDEKAALFQLAIHFAAAYLQREVPGPE